jgi:DNA-directed RNA polymerase I, II, and III subunit RPABC2
MADDNNSDAGSAASELDDLAEEKTQGEVIAELRELANQNQALEFLTRHHPEIRLDYREEVITKLSLESYPPNSGIDKRHMSVPYLTPFEKTKVIGFRANQLAKGAQLLITLGPNEKHITDVLDLARMELEQRRLPFIIKRPMPDGSFEYWRLEDLLIL